MERATVDYIADAKVGDFVWLVKDKWKSWTPELVRIDAVKIKYAKAGNHEFDKYTGFGRSFGGYTASEQFFGETELWVRKNHFSIVKAVQELSAEDLMKVAQLLGIPTPQPPHDRAP